MSVLRFTTFLNMHGAKLFIMFRCLYILRREHKPISCFLAHLQSARTTHCAKQEPFRSAAAAFYADSFLRLPEAACKNHDRDTKKRAQNFKDESRL